MSEPKPLDEVRAAIAKRSKEMKITLKELSKSLGKNDAYMHQFLYRQSPRKLPDRSAMELAEILMLPLETVSHDAPFVPRQRENAAPPLFPVSTNRPNAAEIPVFRDTEVIDKTVASEWTPQPIAGVVPLSFALWITEPRGRLAAGDLAFVKESQPPRVGDTVLVLSENKVSAIGPMTKLTPESAVVQTESGNKTFKKATHKILKVASVLFS
jgi:hypothetical protein